MSDRPQSDRLKPDHFDMVAARQMALDALRNAQHRLDLRGGINDH
jgi:hypothetical protein